MNSSLCAFYETQPVLSSFVISFTLLRTVGMWLQYRTTWCRNGSGSETRSQGVPHVKTSKRTLPYSNQFGLAHSWSGPFTRKRHCRGTCHSFPGSPGHFRSKMKISCVSRQRAQGFSPPRQPSACVRFCPCIVSCTATYLRVNQAIPSLF